VTIKAPETISNEFINSFTQATIREGNTHKPLSVSEVPDTFSPMSVYFLSYEEAAEEDGRKFTEERGRGDGVGEGGGRRKQTVGRQ
jgi:hypothetical protein